jgi:hypothetical protein
MSPKSGNSGIAVEPVGRRQVLRKFAFTWTILALIGVFWALPSSAANLAVGGDFESMVQLADWVPAGTVGWGSVLTITDQAYEGKAALVISDPSDTQAYGLRTANIPVTVGHDYRARAKVTNGGGLYLEFWDAHGTRIANKSTKAPAGNQWTSLEVVLTAPVNAVSATVLVYSYIGSVGQAKFDNVDLRDLTTDAEAYEDFDGEMSADDMQLDYRPAEGALITTNPASFVWVPVSGAVTYEVQVSTTRDFVAETTVSYQDIDISIYTPSTVMDTEPTYYWRVRGITRAGLALPWSDVRSFRYDRHAAQMPLPDLEEVRARIPTEHPRLFVRPEGLEEFRGLRTNLAFRIIADSIYTAAITQSLGGLPTEPVHCRPGGVWDVNLWRQGMNEGVKIMAAIENMAFAYLLTGNGQIGEAVRQWMLTVAGWDPKGATSAAVNDEISMPILYQLSRAYTWAYEALNPEDRQIIRDNIRIRATEAYTILRRLPFESKPFNSHAGRQLGFLGEAAIAFMGEIPEAAEWFDYVLRNYYAVYPAWGGDPGGWAEGQAYWTTYINRVFWYNDALLVATGLNLYDKPFFRNNGYFKLYTQPPYSKMGPFGDHADDPPSPTAAGVMMHYAGVYKNPYFKWYAAQLGGVGSLDPMLYIRSALAPYQDVAVQAPTDLPQARYFEDIGWVAMHRNLADKDENIQFMFKSSPYGSISHSLADQNSFTIEAFGEPLAISSGYRPWYGSDHHMNWTKQTKAHNAVLIDGQGQPIQSIAAKGVIRHFIHGNSFDYALGDALEAYPHAARILRHVVYVRPNVFILFDDIAVKDRQPVTYDWLLHAYRQMGIDEVGNTILVPGESAELAVRFHTQDVYRWYQTNEFEVPLDQPMNKPEQWHLKVTTTAPAAEQVFLTSLIARKTGAVDPAPQVEPLAVRNGYGVQVQDGNVTAHVLFRKENAAADLATTDVEAAALAAAVRYENSEVCGVMLIEGTRLSVDGALWLVADASVQAEATYTASGIEGSVTTGAQTELLIAIDDGLSTLIIDGVPHSLIDKQVDGRRMAVLSLPVKGSYSFRVE